MWCGARDSDEIDCLTIVCYLNISLLRLSFSNCQRYSPNWEEMSPAENGRSEFQRKLICLTFSLKILMFSKRFICQFLAFAVFNQLHFVGIERIYLVFQEWIWIGINNE